MRAGRLFAVVTALLLMMTSAVMAEEARLLPVGIGFALPDGWTSLAIDGDEQAQALGGVYAAQSESGVHLAVCAEPIKRSGESLPAMAKRYRASNRVAVTEAQTDDGVDFVLASERIEALRLSVARMRVNGYALAFVWTGETDDVEPTALSVMCSVRRLNGGTKEDDP